MAASWGRLSLTDVVIELRVCLRPDGTVTEVEIAQRSTRHSKLPAAADSARRAVMISSPLKLPPGKSFASMRLRFYPGQVEQ